VPAALPHSSVQRIPIDDSSEEELSLAALDHPRLTGLYGFWEARRGTRAMPCRADFRPEDMLPFLGYIILVDVEEAPRRFRFRLIGTEIVTSYGIELTGRYTDAVQPPSYRTMVERHYARAADLARPVAHRMSFTEAPGKIHELVRLSLPLSEDGVRVNMLMLASVFGPELARFRERQRDAVTSLLR
jgi:hypothetical protein